MRPHTIITAAIVVLALLAISVLCSEPGHSVSQQEILRSNDVPALARQFEQLRAEIRNAGPLIQYGEVWTPEDGDSALLVFDEPFGDTTWGLGHMMMRDYRDSTEIWSTATRITVGRVWPESCYVKNNESSSKGWIKYIAAGKR